jgi:hypothetical protein
MKKTFIVLQKVIFLLVVVFLSFSNFGCQKENPVVQNDRTKNSSNTDDGFVVGCLTINQLTSDGTSVQILNTGNLGCVGGETYISGLTSFSTLCEDTDDFEINLSGWWTLNPNNPIWESLTFEIYRNASSRTPILVGTVGVLANSGGYHTYTYTYNNELLELQECYSDYAWKVVIVPYDGDNSKK